MDALVLRRSAGAALTALSLALTSLVALPQLAASAVAQDSSPLLKNRLSGPDRAASSFQSLAADGSLAVSAWQDNSFAPSSEIAVSVSDDEGQTWSAPVNISHSHYLGSSRPSVAVEGERIWVTWVEATEKNSSGAGNGDIWATSSADGGRNWDIPLLVHEDRADSMLPQVAIQAGRPVVAWAGLDERLLLATSSDDGETWTAEEVATQTDPFAVRPRLAVADGVAYLAWTGARRERSALGGVHLLAVPPIGEGQAVEVVPPGTVIAGLTLHAVGSTVALGWTERVSLSTPSAARAAVSRDGGRTFADTTSLTPAAQTSVLTDVLVADGDVYAAYSVPAGASSRQQVRVSNDGGAGWGAPMELPAGGGAELSGSPRDSGADGPVATFDYTVADRFGLDEDGDGVTDYRTDAAWLAARTLTVHLDACASVGGALPVVQYEARLGKELKVSNDCAFDLEVPGEGVHDVSLTVVRSDDAKATVERGIEVVDHLVVSFGDSVASGEGVPDIEIGPGRETATWVDRQCHRSAQAGPAEAALELERRDPRSSVTFVSLACSGASILGGDLGSGGLMTPYHGIEPGPALPPQLEAAKALRGDRTVDAAFLSIGANDARFSSFVFECLAVACDETGAVDRMRERLNALPSRYDALAGPLAEVVAPGRVFMSEYYDVTRNSAGTIDMDCAFMQRGLGLSREEAQLAYDEVESPLNTHAHAAASRHGWNFVGGLSAAFATHGYCAQQPWVVRIGESKARQGNDKGAFHPNRAGHDVYGRALAGAAAAHLPLVQAPQEDPGPTSDPLQDLRRSDVHLVYADGRAIHAVPVRPSDEQDPLLPVHLNRQHEREAGNVRVAATPSGPVATWFEMTDDEPGTGGFEVFSTKIPTVPPNLRLDEVRVVQAPRDGADVAAGKQAAVELSVTSTYPTTKHVPVEVTGDGISFTRTVAVPPGRRGVLHLRDASVVPTAGAPFQVTATVDPAGSLDEDAADNTRRSRKQAVVESRPLRLLFVPVNPSSGKPLDCKNVLPAKVDQVLDYLRDVLPVPDGGVTGEGSCASTVKGRLAGDRDSLDGLLSDLAAMRWTAGVDHVVGVAPAGYLGTLDPKTPGAIGWAPVGGAGGAAGGLLIDADAGDLGAVATHEIGHAWGLHHAAATPAPGLRLSTMEVKQGQDLMRATGDGAEWIGATTWKALLDRFAGSIQVRALDAGAQTSLALSLSEGSAGTTAAPWSLVDRAPEVPLDAPGELTLRYLDGDDELARTGLPLSEIEGAATAEAEAGTRTVSALVPWVDGTTRLVVERDGKELLGRDVSPTAPAVSSVTAGPASVDVGGTVALSWAATDGDGDELTYAVDLTRDGGRTWTPLLTRATASTLAVPVDASLGGSTIAFRVTASDGVRTGSAVSAGVPVKQATRNGRVAFSVIHMNTNGGHLSTDIATIAPDGTGLKMLTSTGDAGAAAWTPDGTRIVYGRRGVLWAMDADGSNKAPFVPPGLEAETRYGCTRWSPDGTRMSFLTEQGVLHTIGTDGTGRKELFRPVDGRPFRILTCPVWSPDGRELAAVGREVNAVDDRVFVIDVATGTPRRLPVRIRRDLSLDWSSTNLLLANAADDAGTWFGPSAFDLDGKRVWRLSDHWDGSDSVNWREAAFSPDGSLAVGVTTTGGAYRDTDLEVRKLDGTGRMRLTRVREDVAPDTAVASVAWQPLPSADTPPDPAPAKDLAWLPARYDAVEGKSVLLDATSGARPGGEVPAYAWDLDDDGAFDDAAGSTATFVPSDDGTHRVKVRVQLAGGTPQEASTDVVAVNAPPSLTGGAARASVGGPAALETVRVSDAAAEELTAHVEWETGQEQEVPVVAAGPGAWKLGGEHVYESAGVRTVTARVCDDDGACTSHEVEVDVAARAPEVDDVWPASGPAAGGTTVTVTGRYLKGADVSFGDVPAEDVTAVSDRELAVTVPRLSPGSTVDVTVHGAHGASRPQRFTVDNALPSLTAEDVRTKPGVPIDVPVQAADADGSPVEVITVVEPAHGDLSINGTSVRYVPNEGWAGADEFALAADDGVEGGPADVVTVMTGSGAPLAAGETIEVQERAGSVEVARLLANDVDPEGDEVVLQSATSSTGQVRLTDDSVAFTLPTGADHLELSYVVEDATGMRATGTSWLQLAKATPPPDGGGGTPTPTPTGTPTPTPTGTPTPTPTGTPSPTPTGTPSPTPTSTPVAPRSVDDACPPGEVPTSAFTDVDATVHRTAVECVLWWGIAKGRTPSTYEPYSDVTRAQMASFIAALVRESGGSLPPGPDRFADDDGSVHEQSIDALAAAGIVYGSADGQYAPHHLVTRGQMAAFLVRATRYVHGTAEGDRQDLFIDDDGTTHEHAIDTAASLGFAAGIDGRHYAPQDPVRRDQMASFLSRVLDFLVEQGHRPPPSRR